MGKEEAYCIKPITKLYENDPQYKFVNDHVKDSTALYQYDEDLRAKFNRQPIPPEYGEELLIHMLGWVQEKVHQYTKTNNSAYIKSTEYTEALLKEVRGRNTSTILSAVSSVPNDQETGDEVSRRDVYIKQLELIEMDSTELFSAAYYRLLFGSG